MSLKKLFKEEFVPDESVSDLVKSDEEISEYTEQYFYDLLIDKADEKLEKISAIGSSRMVYKYSDDKVVKVAKSEGKGVAQNKKEGEIGTDRLYENILAKVYYRSENDLFLISEYAKMIKRPEKFKQVSGVHWRVFYYFVDFVNLRMTRVNLRRTGKHTKSIHTSFEKYYKYYFEPDLDTDLSEDDWKQVEENEFCEDFESFCYNYNMDIAGDFQTLTSFGIAKRSEGEKVVLIDYGFDSKIFDKYYL